MKRHLVFLCLPALAIVLLMVVVSVAGCVTIVPTDGQPTPAPSTKQEPHRRNHQDRERAQREAREAAQRQKRADQAQKRGRK